MGFLNYIYYYIRSLKVLIFHHDSDREKQLLKSTITNFYRLKYEKIMNENEAIKNEK